jgi:hypothetical protein
VSNSHVASVLWTERLPVMRSLTFPFALSSIVAALLLISSIAGLLFGQGGLYEPNPATLPSFLTQDVITLVVVVPLLVTCLWLARRGSVRGLVVWMGTLFYVAYAYSFAVLGTWLPPLFLVYVAIVSMSVYGLIFVLVSTDAEAVRARFSDQTPNPLGRRLLDGDVAAPGDVMGGNDRGPYPLGHPTEEHAVRHLAARPGNRLAGAVLGRLVAVAQTGPRLCGGRYCADEGRRGGARSCRADGGHVAHERHRR